MKDFVQKVIVAVNGTQESIHTAMYSIMLARSCNWKLKFVYVVDSATIKYLGMNQILIREEEIQFKDDLINEGNSFLEYMVSLGTLKGVEVETELRDGNVSSEIISVADKDKADMIIISGMEKRKDVRYSSKSVISYHRAEILTNAKCPVLVVQKPDIEAQFKIF